MSCSVVSGWRSRGGNGGMPLALVFSSGSGLLSCSSGRTCSGSVASSPQAFAPDGVGEGRSWVLVAKEDGGMLWSSPLRGTPESAQTPPPPGHVGVSIGQTGRDAAANSSGLDTGWVDVAIPAAFPAMRPSWVSCLARTALRSTVLASSRAVDIKPNERRLRLPKSAGSVHVE